MTAAACRHLIDQVKAELAQYSELAEARTHLIAEEEALLAD